MSDPSVRGEMPVGVRTVQARDAARERVFPCEIWYPAAAAHAGQDLAEATQDAFEVPFGTSPRRQMAVRDAAAREGRYPLIVFSHSSGGGRRQSTFLSTHMCSHGYVVAALDHSELVAPELARRSDETAEQKAARQAGWIANRVPDVRFLLDYMMGEPNVDRARIGIVGHSFGGWTALAAPEVEERIGVVVALAPAGASRTKPGILRAGLTFAWRRDVPTLYIAAEGDVSLPLEGMYELLERTPGTKRMEILRRADHMHFMDDVERMHELVRGMPAVGELGWLPGEMRPVAELCSGEEAHRMVRGWVVGHLAEMWRAPSVDTSVDGAR